MAILCHYYCLPEINVHFATVFLLIKEAQWNLLYNIFKRHMDLRSSIPIFLVCKLAISSVQITYQWRLASKALWYCSVSLFNLSCQNFQFYFFFGRGGGAYLTFMLIQVCKIVEGQRYSKRLNQNQIRALLEETCQRPHDRERDIIQVCHTLHRIMTLYHCTCKFTCLHKKTFSFVCMQMVNHNSYHEDPYAKEFGIKISERLALVEARILPAPRVGGNQFM